MLKWIGQKVEYFKAIFRQDVRIEGVLEIGDVAQLKPRTIKGTDSIDGPGFNLNITASGASGTNQIGGGLLFYPGGSTGNAVSRDIHFGYSSPVASGSNPQSITNALIINGNTGKSTFYKPVTISGALYSTNNDVLSVGSYGTTSITNGRYGLPGNKGVDNSTWGFNYANGASDYGNSSQHIGIRVPYKCILIGAMGNVRSTATGDVKFAIWSATLIDGETGANQTWTKNLETDAINIVTAARVYGFSKTDGTVVLNAGDSVVPSILNSTGVSNVMYGTYTILIRRVE